MKANKVYTSVKTAFTAITLHLLGNKAASVFVAKLAELCSACKVNTQTQVNTYYLVGFACGLTWEECQAKRWWYTTIIFAPSGRKVDGAVNGFLGGLSIAKATSVDAKGKVTFDPSKVTQDKANNSYRERNVYSWPFHGASVCTHSASIFNGTKAARQKAVYDALTSEYGQVLMTTMAKATGQKRHLVLARAVKRLTEVSKVVKDFAGNTAAPHKAIAKAWKPKATKKVAKATTPAVEPTTPKSESDNG